MSEKKYYFDDEGKLLLKNNVKLSEEEKERLRSKYNLNFESYDKNPADEFKRTAPAIGVRFANETLDLYRMLRDIEPVKKIAKNIPDFKGKDKLVGKANKALNPFYQPLSDKAEYALDDAVNQKLKTFYNFALGEDNIRMEDRGDRPPMPIVKSPDGIGKEVTREMGGFVASMIGVGKLKVIKGVGDAPSQLKKYLPSKFKKLAPSKGFKQGLVAGEVATQLAFNPNEDLLFQYIADAIPKDSKNFQSLKEFLNTDTNDNELEKRLKLLGEGLVLTGVASGVFKGIGFASNVTGVTKVGQLSLQKIKEGGEGFIEMLKEVKQGGQESIDKFFKGIEDSTELNKAQKRLALKHRKKDIADGKVVGEGDVSALKPGPIASKFGFKTNLMFSESSLARTMESWRRKIATTRGNRTRELHEKYLKAENKKESWDDTIANLGFNAQAAIENVVQNLSKGKFKNKEDLLDQINTVLYTDFRTPTIVGSKRGISVGKRQKQTFEKELNKLPEVLREPLRNARKLQDELTEAMIDSGTLTLKQQEMYRDQLGFYVRRSYKLFEDPNYIPTTSVLKDAEVYLTAALKKSNPKLDADEILAQVKAEIDDILDVRQGSSLGSSMDKFERVRKEILKGRKEIPTELRRLMGEIEDPIQAFIHSTAKLSNYVENVKFYDDAFESGAGIYFREAPEGAFKELIPEGFGNLSGRHTTKELWKYFSGYKKMSENLLAGDNMLSGTYRNALMLKGLSQASKTVWSHTTHVKNVAGGVQMSLANGVNVFSIKETKKIVKILRAKTSNDRELQAFHEELSSLGLLNKGVVARDLKGLANDLGKMKKGFVSGKLDWVFDKTGLKKLGEKAQNAYVAEDDFFKINMYLRETDYLKQMNDKLVDGSKYKMTEQQLKERAAGMVRDTLPNYDLVPELLQDLRRTPFFGRFFSFMAESVRITGNSVMNGIKEVKLGRQMKKDGDLLAGQEVIKRGQKRLVAFTVMAGAGAKGAEKVSQVASGFTTELVDAAKDFLPDYMQNSNVVVSVAPDGSPVVANLSSWDAYDFPKKPFQVLINKYLDSDTIDEEGLAQEIMTTVLSETVSPFLGESIIQEQLGDFFYRGGRTIEGKAMKNAYNKNRFQDTGNFTGNIFNTNNLMILLSNMTESITPGSITRAKDLHKTLTADTDKTSFDQDIYEAQAFMKFVTGWGMQPLNPEYISSMYKMKANKLAKKKSEFRRELFDGVDGTLEVDKFTNKYLDVNNRYYKETAKFHKLTKSLKAFKLEPLTVLQESRLSKKDKVTFFTETFQPLGLTDDMKISLIDKTNGNTDIFWEVLADINAIDSQMSQLPIYYNPEYYRTQRKKVKEIKEELRENYKTGGIVPNVEEDPANRKNPITNKSYSDFRLKLTRGGSPTLKKYYGSNAIAEVTRREGTLNSLQEHIVNEEGFVDGEYKDTKNILTSGAGQTGEFMGQSFKETYKVQLQRVKEKIPNFDNLPENKQKALMSLGYRGDVGKNHSWVKLFNEKKYEAAATELLNHKEYLEYKKIASKGGEVNGIIRRLEEASKLIKN